MDGASVDVDMTALIALMEMYRGKGKNQREAMRHAALMLVEEVDDMFETSGHGTWKPLAPGTKRRRGNTDAAKLLMDTGRLAASITAAYTGNTAEAFTNVEYAKFHIEGTASIPKRDFFDIDRDAVTLEFAEFVLQEIS